MPVSISRQVLAGRHGLGVILLVSSLACGISGTFYGGNTVGGYAGGYRKYTQLNNYITAIEDKTTVPSGFMVMTADYSYAIVSPRLKVLGWKSITVNGPNVFIVTIAKTTKVTGLFRLDEGERDVIAEIRSEFIQKLAGLKLTQSSAGSLFFANKQTYDPSQDGGEASYAENAIDVLAKLIGQKYNQVSSEVDDDGRAYQETAQNAPGELPVRWQGESNDEGLDGAGNESQQKKTQLEASARSAKEPVKNRTLERTSGDDGGELTSSERALNPSYGNERYGSQFSYVSSSRYNTAKQNYCSRRGSAHFNYHNLQASLAWKKLLGDVYNFDLRCNIHDVFTTSVSIYQQPGVSILYRDEAYFAYARSNLPLYIHRFFVFNEFVFFVYSDASLLVKPSWLLEPLELDLVVQARKQLISINTFKSEPEQSASSGTLPPIEGTRAAAVPSFSSNDSQQTNEATGRSLDMAYAQTSTSDTTDTAGSTTL